MILKSEVTGKEYEVKTFTAEEGKCGICHESLQKILEDEDWDYTIEVAAATEYYAAVRCIIHSDELNRKIVNLQDINTRFVDAKDKTQERFTKAHPLVVATQNAVDAAVRAFLKWPRIIAAEEKAAAEETKENEKTEMNEEELDQRIIELGKMKPPTNSRYAKMTFAEIWDASPGWFDYILKNNRSDTYKEAREYVILMRKREKKNEQKAERRNLTYKKNS